MSKRVLITGSAGFVGHHAVEHFVAKTDWHIIGIDSLRHRGDSKRVTVSPERFTHFTHDLSAPVSDRLIHDILNCNGGGDIDYVLMLASESHVDRSITWPTPFILNNVQVALHTLELCRTLMPSKIINCSTDEIFGPAAEGYAHHEWDVVAPSNPYAASKAAQDAICFSYWRTYAMPIMVTHCMNMIGERQDPEKFIPLCIKNILAGHKINIHASGDTQKIGSRMYLHARNLADAWLFLLNTVTPTLYDGTNTRLDKFNVVGEMELNNLEVAEFIAKVLGKELKHRLVDFHATRPGHDPRYALDGAKMKNLGWSPPVSLLESLERTVKWTAQHPEWLV